MNHGTSSHWWKGILWGRDLLLNHLGKSICNEESIWVWQDSWIMSTPALKPHGPMQEKDQDLMVSDLLSKETREWNSTLIAERFRELLHHIQLIKPSLLGAKDVYIWTADKSSSYSVKSCYNSLHYPSSLPTSPLSSLFPAPHTNSDISVRSTITITPTANLEFYWKKNIWNIPLSPKLKHFLWKAAQESLPTGVNLQCRGAAQNTNCVHCNGQKTTLHAIFQCCFAQQV